MRDFLFFPLAAALASAFIFVAANPFASRLPTGPVSGGGRNAQDITVEGEELNRFVLGELAGVNIDLMHPADGKPFLHIDRQSTDKYDDPRLGPHLILAEDLELALESRPIEVVIEARSVGDFPATEFQASYFAKTESESGWQTFTLTREFQPYTLTFYTPKRGREEGYDYIGIRPVAPDKHRVMDVRSVEIRSTGKKGAPPVTQPSSQPVLVP